MKLFVYTVLTNYNNIFLRLFSKVKVYHGVVSAPTEREASRIIHAEVKKKNMRIKRLILSDNTEQVERFMRGF